MDDRHVTAIHYDAAGQGVRSRHSSWPFFAPSLSLRLCRRPMRSRRSPPLSPRSLFASAVACRPEMLPTTEPSFWPDLLACHPSLADLICSSRSTVRSTLSCALAQPTDGRSFESRVPQIPSVGRSRPSSSPEAVAAALMIAVPAAHPLLSCQPTGPSHPPPTGLRLGSLHVQVDGKCLTPFARCP